MCYFESNKSKLEISLNLESDRIVIQNESDLLVHKNILSFQRNEELQNSTLKIKYLWSYGFTLRCFFDSHLHFFFQVLIYRNFTDYFTRLWDHLSNFSALSYL